jgi:hypothetical protein
MRSVVVIAQAAEGIPAALRTAIRTNRCSAVTALRLGRLAARRTYVIVTGYVFDLTEWRHERQWFELFRVMQLMPKTFNDQTDQTIRGSIREKRPI